jgi:hypothetical protein
MASPTVSAKNISSSDTGSRSLTACHTVCPEERAAEIALQHVTEPAQVPPPQRLIEPHVMAQRGDLFRRRLVAEDHVSQIARQQ